MWIIDPMNDTWIYVEDVNTLPISQSLAELE